MLFKSRLSMVATLAAVLWFSLTASNLAASTSALQQINAGQLLSVVPELDGVNDLTGKVQRVAVIDSGIDFDHAGLGGRVVAGVNMAAGATWGATTPSAYDDRNGHGTFVSGVIGSSDPTRPGIATGVELVSVRVLASDGQGSLLDLALGLEWVVQNAVALNITTVNISIGLDQVYGSPTDVPTYSSYRRMKTALDTLEQMNIVTASAAGNDGSATAITAPAIYQSVLAVGATDNAGKIASFSNRSSELEILAPGVNISSLWKNNGLSVGSGTSYASPVIAGASVLIREAYELFTTDLDGEFDSFSDRVADLLDRTGSSVTDPLTGSIYKQIDLFAAINAVYAEFGQSLLSESPIPTVPEPATVMILILGISLIVSRRGDSKRMSCVA